MYMRPKNWIEVVQREYLQRFIRAGGSAVKFAVLLENIDPNGLRNDLKLIADNNHYLFATVSADHCKLHMIEHLFFTIARQVDWDQLARGILRKVFNDNGYLFPDEDDTSVISADASLSLAMLAELNDRVPSELRRDINIWLEKAIYHRTDISLEFRIAIIRLCTALLDLPSDHLSQHLHDAVMDWLHGDLRRITELKTALIYQKITRNNARSMLLSLSIIAKMAGFSGLVIHLDIERYLLARRPKTPDDKLYFTKAATMDLYEVLRQIIDGTDRQQHCLTVVTAPLTIVQDSKRGISIYTALRDRTVDDVRDRTYANPMAPLTRLAHCGDPVIIPDPQVNLPEGASVQAQRAIEALRCGVPNEDAVRELSSSQPRIHERFQHQLERLIDHPQEQSPGMIVAGGFGGGKSHLLQYLQHVALEQNFVCSKVVISKETPLFDPYKMFTAAMRNLRLPGNHFDEMNSIVQRLNPESQRYAALKAWLSENATELSSRFAATLFLYSQLKTDTEFRDRIVRYWCGDKLLDSEIKRKLRQLGELQSYQFQRVKKQDLAMQRVRFAAQLMVAAGYDGWVLLLDEAELIGRYSLLQRSRSYGQMAHLLGKGSGWKYEGTTSVVAITDDYQSAILDEKNDIEKVPNRLLARGTDVDRLLARTAERCMKTIQKDRILLKQPDSGVIDGTFQQVQNVYRSAYWWEPTAIQTGERLSSSPMRHFVKGWITEWDLNRYHPEHSVDITTESISTDYSEDQQFELSSEQGKDEFDRFDS